MATTTALACALQFGFDMGSAIQLLERGPCEENSFLRKAREELVGAFHALSLLEGSGVDLIKAKERIDVLIDRSSQTQEAVPLSMCRDLANQLKDIYRKCQSEIESKWSGIIQMD